MAGMPMTASMTAVRTRLPFIVGLVFQRSDLPVAPVPLTEGFERLAVFFFAKIRPTGLSDIPLGISGLPDEEIAHAQLAGGTDDQVRVGDAGRKQVMADQLGGDVLG